MADNLKGIPFSTNDEGVDHIQTAKELVVKAYDKNARNDMSRLWLSDVYVVWFSHTLGNWKALLSTVLPDGAYYEVIYDREKKITYVDTYIKIAQNITPDIPKESYTA